MDKKNLVNLITEALHKCDDLMLLELIYKILLRQA
jgi:hypothetical protein